MANNSTTTKPKPKPADEPKSAPAGTDIPSDPREPYPSGKPWAEPKEKVPHGTPPDEGEAA